MLSFPKSKVLNDQMNSSKHYFLAYFMQNIKKLKMRGPRTSNVTVKFIASPFSSFWRFNSGFVLQTTETPVFMFSLLRLFE